VVAVTGADERVRVWIDTQLLLDQWQSLAALELFVPYTTPPSHARLEGATSSLASGACPSAGSGAAGAGGRESGVQAVGAGSGATGIRIEYKEESGPHGLALRWFKGGMQPAAVPLHAMCTISLVPTPTALTVEPALPGDLSRARGAGLTLASIGKLASFTILARDRFGNNVSSSSSSSSPHFFFYSNATMHLAMLECVLQKALHPHELCNASARSCTTGQYYTRAHVLGRGRWEGGGSSLYSMSMVATMSGNYSHVVQAFQPGGLQVCDDEPPLLAAAC